MAKPTTQKRVTKPRRRAIPASKRRAVPARKKRTSASTRKRTVSARKKRTIVAPAKRKVSARRKRGLPSSRKSVMPVVQPRVVSPNTREPFPPIPQRFPERVFDKRPMRMPRRPAAARFEPGHRTGAKKRLGRTG